MSHTAAVCMKLGFCAKKQQIGTGYKIRYDKISIKTVVYIRVV